MNTAQENIVERLGNNPNDTEARIAFDQFCKADPAFRDEAALHLAAMAALKQEQKQRLRAVLESPDMLVIKEQVFHTRVRRKWWLVALGMILFLSIGLFMVWNQKTSSGQNTQPLPSINPQVRDTQPILTQPMVEKKPETVTPEKTNRKPEGEHKRLFAQYFTPYDPSFWGRQNRGSKKTEHVFFSYYAASDYRNAVANEPVDSLSSTWLFYRANAWMAVGYPEKALLLMEQIDSRQNILLGQQVKWYKALAYLQKGDLKTAKPLLRVIADQPQGAFKQPESAAILKLLEGYLPTPD